MNIYMDLPKSRVDPVTFLTLVSNYGNQTFLALPFLRVHSTFCKTCSMSFQVQENAKSVASTSSDTLLVLSPKFSEGVNSPLFLPYASSPQRRAQ